MESQRSEVITFLHDLRPSLSSSSKAFDATTALVHRFDEAFFGALTKAEQRSLVVQPLLEGNRVDILLSLWHDFSAAEQHSPYKCDKLLYFAREFVRGALPVILQDLCSADTDTHLHSKLAQCLVSLPDRASNLKGSRRESSFFTSEKYLRFLAVSYYESLQHARDMLSKSMDCTLAFHALLLSKLQRTGHFRPFMSIVIPWLARAAQRDFIYRRISRRLLDGLAPGSRLSIFAETIRLCSSVKALDCVLNDAVTENEAIRHVVCDQLLVSRPFTDLKEIRKVCHYLSLTPERSAVLADVFLQLLRLWSRKVNIDQRPFDEHVRTAKSALICLCYLDIHQVCVESTRLVTAGLQEHLSIPAEEVRHHGLAAGQLMCNELYGAYNNIPGSSQEEPLKELNFDLPESVMQPYAELLRCPAESNDDAQQLTDDVEALLNLEEDTSEEPLAQPTVDSDDDDGDQIEQRELPTLHYLPDAMNGLLERNDPLKFDCALNSLVLLLRREASGLRDIAEELTDILFTLENLFATRDFDALRNEAMTRVCVCHPDLVAPLLARKFYGRGFNQRQRMDALTVLRAAAERLSGVDADTSESPAAVASAITPPTPTDDWYAVVQARIERNTKRRSASKSKKDKPAPNRYAAVCSHFFYPLLPSRQRDNPDGTLNLHDRDHTLLAQLLSTLATALHCAETATELPRMADEMYLLCLQLRFHGEVAVRQAVHYALCLTTAALPASLIDTEPYISICIELHALSVLQAVHYALCLTTAALPASLIDTEPYISICIELHALSVLQAVHYALCLTTAALPASLIDTEPYISICIELHALSVLQAVQYALCLTTAALPASLIDTEPYISICIELHALSVLQAVQYALCLTTAALPASLIDTEPYISICIELHALSVLQAVHYALCLTTAALPASLIDTEPYISICIELHALSVLQAVHYALCLTTAALPASLIDTEPYISIYIELHALSVLQAVHYALCLTTAALPASLIDTEPYISICIELHALSVLQAVHYALCLTTAALPASLIDTEPYISICIELHALSVLQAVHYALCLTTAALPASLIDTEPYISICIELHALSVLQAVHNALCLTTAALPASLIDTEPYISICIELHALSVLQAVHYALCLTTAALPASLIDTEPYISICIELHEWMLMLLKRETNEQCLTLAAQLQIIMKGKQDEIEHAVTGASVPKIQVLSST